MSANLGSYGSSALGAFLQSALAARGHPPEADPVFVLAGTIRGLIPTDTVSAIGSDLIGSDASQYIAADGSLSDVDPSDYIFPCDFLNDGTINRGSGQTYDFTDYFSVDDPFMIAPYDGTGSGNANPRTTYYVLSVSETVITISETEGGSQFVPTNSASDCLAFRVLNLALVVDFPAGHVYMGNSAANIYTYGANTTEDDFSIYLADDWSLVDSFNIEVDDNGSETYHDPERLAYCWNAARGVMAIYCIDPDIAETGTFIAEIEPDGTLHAVLEGPGESFSGDVLEMYPTSTGYFLISYDSGGADKKIAHVAETGSAIKEFTNDAIPLLAYGSVNDRLIFSGIDSGSSFVYVYDPDLAMQAGHEISGMLVLDLIGTEDEYGMIGGSFSGGSVAALVIGGIVSGAAKAVTHNGEDAALGKIEVSPGEGYLLYSESNYPYRASDGQVTQSGLSFAGNYGTVSVSAKSELANTTPSYPAENADRDVRVIAGTNASAATAQADVPAMTIGGLSFVTS